MLKRFLSGALKVLITVTFTVFLVALFCILSFIIYAVKDKGLDVSELSTLAKAQDRTTKLYYIENEKDGVLTTAELEGEELFASQNREWVRYSEIPENLINAFVAVEDHRFFEHSGIDKRRTAGAIIGFITGKSSYGGSTINQQLIKNVSGENDYSVSRKVREMIKAVKLDRELSKSEILELYLNTIYLSQNSYGVGAAAEAYFNKEVSELTLTECAALACIPQSPTKWDPIRNPENNSSRRNTVLNRMYELGYITKGELDGALNTELKIADDRTRKSENGEIYSWYTESVIDECIALLLENGIAKNEQTAKKLLYTGGLSVVTAQNPKMQKEVERYFENESNFYTVGALIHPECSMVVIDPKNGRILALAGATGKKSANRTLNYATGTRRSPGSSIKPLSVYAPALDKGYITYGSVIDDTPVRFVSDGYGGTRGWPQNYPQGYRGLTTVRDAISRSVNTVAVKILQRVGAENSFNLLHGTMKMSSLVSEADKKGATYTDIAESPLALGQLTRGITVSEITAGYTALANGGLFSEASTVVKIFDAEGKLLVDNEKAPVRVFSPETACIMTKLLQNVTGSGTASKMTLKKTVECAGKTGTTTKDQDRWFIGYTPDLLAGVWFGYPTPKSLDAFSHSPSPSLTAFDNVMKLINTEECLGSHPKAEFDTCEGIVTAKYCRDSGKLMTSACACDPRGSRAETGYFTKDTVPTEYCDTHRLVLYDTVNGGVAGQGCDIGNCRYVGLLNVRRSLPSGTVISDAQYVCYPLPFGATVCLDQSKPYFYYAYPYGGRSAVTFPFNRYCTGCHLGSQSKESEDGENGVYEDE